MSLRGPTRGELKLAQKEAQEARLERDAALLELEGVRRLLAEGAVDQLVADRDRLAATIDRARLELAGADAAQLARGPEIFGRWRDTLLDSLGGAP